MSSQTDRTPAIVFSSARSASVGATRPFSVVGSSSGSRPATWAQTRLGPGLVRRRDVLGGLIHETIGARHDPCRRFWSPTGFHGASLPTTRCALCARTRSRSQRRRPRRYRRSSFRKHADKRRPQRPILLAVDQQFGERSRLGIAPVRAESSPRLRPGMQCQKSPPCP